MATKRALLQERLKYETPLFARAAAKIINKRAELVPAEPRPWQLRFDAALEAQRQAGLPMRAIVLKSRKLGYSSWVQIKLMQRLTQLPNRKGMVVAHDTDTANELFEIGRVIYEHLPPEIKPPLANMRNSKGTAKFMQFGERARAAVTGLNSMIEVDTAKEVQSGRGYTLHYLHLSEVAFWQDEGKLTSLLNAVPYEPETMIVLESTANGHNFFRERWIAAEEGTSRYVPVFAGWTEDPDARLPFRSDEERERFIESIGTGPWGDDEPRLIEEFGCTPEQLNWRRMMIVDQTESKVEKFKQEYPACLTAEMRVSTDQGIVRIADAGEALCTESGPIKRWGRQVPSQIYRLRTKDGRILRGTHDHPVQTDQGLIWLSKLKPGMRVELRQPRFAQADYTFERPGFLGGQHVIQMTPKLGRFLGYFMGDGSWHDDTLSIACDAKDSDVIEDVADLVGAFVAQPKHREIVRVQGRKGCVELRTHRRALRASLECLGLVGTNGSGGWRREICVPESIWRSSRATVREFLRGLFEADGSSSARVVRWASSKELFARDVQLLLLGFGINAPMRPCLKRAGSGHEYISWVLDLGAEGSRRFHDEIGFIGARKRAGRSEPSHIGRPALRRPMWDEVAEVVEDGFEATYDFTMDTEDHLFMAQGIVTHNTPDEAFIASGRQVFSPVLVSKVLDRTRITDPAVPTPVHPGPLKGVLTVGQAEHKVSPRGPVEVPISALWVPAQATGFAVDHPFWRVWEPPQEKGQYVLAADPASDEEASQGASELAFHAAYVLDHKSLEQVAEYRFRGDPDQFATQIHLGALYFNHAWLAVERTGGWGLSILHKLWVEYRYPKLYFRRKLDAKEDKMEQRLGWDTQRSSKRMLEDGARQVLREGTHGIKSSILGRELTTYIRKANGSTGPDKHTQADLLMAWMIAHQVALEKPTRPDTPSGPVSTVTRPIHNPRLGY